MVVQNGKVPYFSELQKLFFREAEAVVPLVPVTIDFYVEIHADTDLALEFLHAFELNFVLDNRYDDQSLALQLLDKLHVALRLRAVANNTYLYVELYLLYHPHNEKKLVRAADIEIRTLGDRRKHELTVLVDLHRVVVKKSPAIPGHFYERIECFDKVSHAVLDDSGKEYFGRGPVFFNDIINIVLVVSLAHEERPLRGNVEGRCIDLLAAQEPKFLVAVLFFLLVFCPFRTFCVHL